MAELIAAVESVSDVERVELARFTEGVLEIELQTIWASRDRQPDVSWDLVSLLFAEVWGDPEEFLNIVLLFGGAEPLVDLTTFSADGDYRYNSQTTVETLQDIRARTVSRDEWAAASGAGFQ